MTSLSNSLSYFLSTSQKTNEIVAKMISIGEMNLGRSDPFAKVLMEYLKSDPNIMSVEFANKNNESVGVARDIFDNDFAVGISGRRTNYSYNLYSVDDYTNLRSVVWTSPAYDSRLRPWYLQALEAGKPAWTPIYLWPNGEYGIDNVSPVKIDGKIEGVVDVSIRLNEIQAFVERAKNYPNSQIFILEKDGSVVAGTGVEDPDLPGNGVGKRIISTESINVVLKEAVGFLTKKYGSLNEVVDGSVNTSSLNGRQYYLTTLNYKGVSGIDWVLVVVTLESDFIGDIRTGTDRQMILMGGLLTISLIMSWLLGRYISVPLSKLVEATESMKNEGEVIDVDVRRNDEMGTLAKSFVEMRERINYQLLSLKENEISTQTKRNELQSILLSIGDAVLVIDKKGEILLFNKVAQELTGVTSDKAMGRSYKEVVDFVNEKTKEPTNDFIAEAITKNKITEMANHTMLVRKDGSMLPVADSAAPVKNAKGETVGCVVVFRDVTRERNVESAKTELVSLASHQMRTPLTAINWYSELLLDSKFGEMSKDQNSFIGAIHESCAKMTTLVDALLNVSRIEMGTFLIEPVEMDIKDLARQCVDDLELDIKKKMIEVSQEIDTDIGKFVADPRLLGIIFQNLLSNAVKYSGVGGHIRFAIQKGHGQLKISVQDYGTGILLSDHSKVFGKLFRSENAKKIDPSGNGLGLYIVKEIVDHANGKVWFESVENQGTTFFVTFPITGMVKREGDKRII
jgi:two-component system sensor histidine kinase VicK